MAGNIGGYISPGITPFAAGSIPSGTISSGTISRFALSSGAVNSGQVASGAIIGQGGGGAFNVGSGTLNQFDLANASVLSGAIGSGQIASGHFTSGLLNAIAGTPVSSGEVQSGAVASGAVIGQAGGGAFNIGSGTLSTNDFGSGAVVRACQFTSPFQIGTTWSLTAQETISGLRAVCVSPSGNLQIAMAANSGRMPAVGIVIDNVLSGNAANVYSHGMFQIPVALANFSGWLGKDAWVGRSGQIVQWSGSFNSGGFTITAGGDYIQRVGVIINSGAIVASMALEMNQSTTLGVTSLVDTANTNFGT